MNNDHGDKLTNWTIETDEVSAGVYKVVAKHRLGPSIERSGTNPEDLIREVKLAAKQMD